MKGVTNIKAIDQSVNYDKTLGDNEACQGALLNRTIGKGLTEVTFG